jgi:hypothetical protein
VDNPFALRKKSKSDQQKSLESASANSREINSRVMQWLVLSRDSLQGFNAAHRALYERPYEPASHFPQIPDHLKFLILDRAGPLSSTLFARGHRETPLLLLTSLE